jgi:uroporphyrinogen III methyltransferase/synthase
MGALEGKRILITRPPDGAGEMAEYIKKEGGEPVIIPAIELKRIRSPEIEKTIKNLKKYDWLIFTSANAVEFFFEILLENKIDLRRLSHLKIGVIGEKTAESLQKKGIFPDLLPERFVAESIVEEFKKIQIKGKKILIPRAEVAREVLPEQLKNMGAKVHVLPIYRTVKPRGLQKRIYEELKKGVDMVVFTSSSTVKNFMEIKGIKKFLNIPFAVIGPVTAETLTKYGFKPSVMPEKYTAKSLVKEISKFFRKFKEKKE